MDDSLPNPKPFNPPPSNPSGPTPTTNPYDTEIPTDTIEHTPERPQTPIATSPLTNNPPPTPPSAEEVRSSNIPHKPHHFATKNAVILGILFLITAGLSSVVTFALVNSRSQKVAPVQQAPVSKISPTPDPMATWQTYTDVLGTYSLKYPLEYQIYNSANNTTILGSADQVALYKQVELQPSSVEKPSTLSISVLPSQIYTPDATAVTENVTLAGKEFSKITTTDSVGISSIEYIYSDADHLYRMAYVKGVNDNDFEKVINSFSFTSPSATTPSGIMTACTMEAKVCPDGSSVGRIPPSCEFAACP